MGSMDEVTERDMVDARVLTETLLIYREWKVTHIPPGTPCCGLSTELFERLDKLEESLLGPADSVEA